ncbi:hypothetical protein GN316_21225 [Xylophilus sp. Kf1]|nr:hypothetical protein [Xylophilus sp. Kf1]
MGNFLCSVWSCSVRCISRKGGFAKASLCKSLGFCLKVFLGLCGISMGHHAFACSVIITTSVFFDQNSAVIERMQMAALTDWVAQVENDYPDREAIIIVPNVDETEADGNQLGRMRELAVRLALLDLIFTASIVEPSEKVFIWPAGALGDGEENDVKRVELQIIPKQRDACK